MVVTAVIVFVAIISEIAVTGIIGIILLHSVHWHCMLYASVFECSNLFGIVILFVTCKARSRLVSLGNHGAAGNCFFNYNCLSSAIPASKFLRMVVEIKLHAAMLMKPGLQQSRDHSGRETTAHVVIRKSLAELRPWNRASGSTEYKRVCPEQDDERLPDLKETQKEQVSSLSQPHKTSDQ